MINETTKEILAILTKNYAPPAYGFLQEVRNGTGYLKSTRTCDGLAMSLYPSRGLELIGFEIKTYRSDWIKELKNPEKSDDFVNFCDKWYLVASDESIVQAGELPLGWGLMVLKGKKLVIKTLAPQRKPEPIDRLFLASIFRDFTEGTVPRDSVNKIVKNEVEAQIALQESRWKSDATWEIERAKRDLEKNLKEIKEFEEKSGIKFDNWNMGRIGRAVKIVLESDDIENRERQLGYMRDSAKRICEEIDSILKTEK